MPWSVETIERHIQPNKKIIIDIDIKYFGRIK